MTEVQINQFIQSAWFNFFPNFNRFSIFFYFCSPKQKGTVRLARSGRQVFILVTRVQIPYGVQNTPDNKFVFRGFIFLSNEIVTEMFEKRENHIPKISCQPCFLHPLLKITSPLAPWAIRKQNTSRINQKSPIRYPFTTTSDAK